MTGLVNKTMGIAVAFIAVSVLTANMLSHQKHMDDGGDRQQATSVQMIQPDASPARIGGSAVVLQGNTQGHFAAMPSIEGVRIPMLVDTGASFVALSEEDASRAGIRPLPADFTARINTANGVAKGAPVTLREVSLEGITVRNVNAIVLQRGKLRGSLLGMSFLSRLSGFQIENNRLYLRQ